MLYVDQLLAGGGLFAWIAANTNVPGRRLLTPLMAVNLFVPFDV